MTAKSNKLTERDFDRLKSGQTVWRVWFLVRRGKLVPHVSMRTVVGKRVSNKHKSQQKGYPTHDFFCRDAKKSFLKRYISDIKGMGCFWTKKTCDKFVTEVLNGKHPDIQQRIVYYNDNSENLIRSYDR